MKKLKERFFKYDKMDRDIFFTTIIKNNKGRHDFVDTAKCMVWEENRTRYETDPTWRVLVDYSKKVRKTFDMLMNSAKLPQQRDQVKNFWDLYNKEEIVPNFSPKDYAKLNFYWRNFPFNEPSWPDKAYLSHPPKKRRVWNYDPEVDRKQYESLRFKSVGDKADMEYAEGWFKKTTTKVPVVIEIDPLYDEANLKRVLSENVNEVHEMGQQARAVMEKEGYVFPDVQLKYGRPRSLYQTGLRYLGYYRLYKCEGWEFHQVDQAFEKAWGKKKATPIEKETFMRKVGKVLPHLHL
jgi:hypothetical protein